MSRHFGDMLLERRRQLGISIQQVSNIVKIRPQIIEYFETENFSAMPPRGYAQGMIASYARYLGLNPDMVVDAYFDALHEYEHGTGARVGRFADAAADASPRSSNAPARYMMVNAVPQSRFAQRPPQAGYVSESTSPHEPLSSAHLRPAGGGDRGARSARAYASSPRGRSRGPEGRYASERVRPGYQGARPVREGRGPRSRAADPYAAPPRPMRSNQYSAGRMPRDSDHARRTPRAGSARGRGGSGFVALLDRFDPRLLLAAGVFVLVMLCLAGFLLLRGCAPEPATDSGSSNAPSESVDNETNASSDGGTASDDEEDSDNTPAKDASSDDEPEETIVKVSLKEKGTMAWVEVKLDGKIVLGKQVLGPFEEQFTVSSQIDITTDSPSAVAVYKNGEKVRYDTKVSGVGKVSILAPEKKDDKVVDSDGDGTPDMTAEEAKAAGIDQSQGTTTNTEA